VEFDGAIGTRRDIGISGIYFETSRRFRRDARIRFSLVFAYARTAGPAPLAVEGRTVRVERLADEVGVAARILSCRIEG
jgi:hypothetical protein